MDGHFDLQKAWAQRADALKSHLRETLNLLAVADSSTDTKWLKTIKLVENGLNWLKLVENCEKWLKLVKNG